jgi:FSR family fosmidomycin resistance protein-like MFS transporter
MYIIELYGFSSLPVIVVLSLLCAAVIVAYRRDHHDARCRPRGGGNKEGSPKTSWWNTSSLGMVFLIVIMRSWTQIGLMTYIPFYFIDYLKGDPLYAGKLVFIFLFCGAVGRWSGPIADRFRPLVLRAPFHVPLHGDLPVMFVPAVEKSLFLFVVLGVQGMLLVSSFSVTIVMAQKAPSHEARASRRTHGGICHRHGGSCRRDHPRSRRGHYGVPVALYSISVLPALGSY